MRTIGLTFRCAAILAALSLAAGCAHHPGRALLSPEDMYDKPLVSPGSQFTKTPPPVQRAITAEAGAAEIACITPTTNHLHRVVYVVRFVNQYLFPPLYLAADGSVLAPDLRVEIGAPGEELGGVLIGSGKSSAAALADFLPPEVLRTLKDRAPVTGIARLAKQAWGDRSVYIVTFKDPALYPTLYIQSDGTLLTQGQK